MKNNITHPNKRNLQSNTRAKQDLTNPARKPITQQIAHRRANIYTEKDKSNTNLTNINTN